MENAPRVGSTHNSDLQEYAEFCRNCGLFLVDGLQVWRDALKAMGMSDRAIQVKVASALKQIRRMGHSA